MALIKENLPYRPNVGMCIINKEGLILACKRSKKFIGHKWQMPQGGIDKGEEPEQTMWRELQEETGITKNEAILLAEHTDWLEYDWPDFVISPDRPFRGQRQKWFLVHYEADEDVDLSRAEHDEFALHRWVKPKWLMENVVDFRITTYRKVFAEFEALIKAV